MSDTAFQERRRWYRHFPEGSLEFLVATRVLAVVLLLALVVLREAQRPMILTALVAVLWFDYVLMMWWAVQLAGDLAALSGGADRQPVRIAVRACLPSVAAAVFLAPWVPVAALRVPVFGGLTAGRLVAVVVFVALLVPAQRAMRRIDLGRPLWTLLAMVPGVHFFALHRIAAGLQARIGQLEPVPPTGAATPRPESAAMAAADATWVLAACPWLIGLAVSIARGDVSSDAVGTATSFCGMCLFAVFAVADLAALERVQRHFIRLIRRG